MFLRPDLVGRMFLIEAEISDQNDAPPIFWQPDDIKLLAFHIWRDADGFIVFVRFTGVFNSDRCVWIVSISRGHHNDRFQCRKLDARFQDCDCSLRTGEAFYFFHWSRLALSGWGGC